MAVSVVMRDAGNLGKSCNTWIKLKRIGQLSSKEMQFQLKQQNYMTAVSTVDDRLAGTQGTGSHQAKISRMDGIIWLI